MKREKTRELVEFRLKLPPVLVTALRRMAADRTPDGGKLVWWSDLARQALSAYVQENMNK